MSATSPGQPTSGQPLESTESDRSGELDRTPESTDSRPALDTTRPGRVTDKDDSRRVLETDVAHPGERPESDVTDSGHHPTSGTADPGSPLTAVAAHPSRGPGVTGEVSGSLRVEDDPDAPPPPETLPSDVAPASRISRLAAAWMDGLLTLLLALPLLIAAQGQLNTLVEPGRVPAIPTTASWVFGALLVALLAFQAFLAATRGQSVGKAVMGIAVAPVEDRERTPGFVRGVVLRRWLRPLAATALAHGLASRPPGGAPEVFGASPLLGTVVALPASLLLVLAVDALVSLLPIRRGHALALHDLVARTLVVTRGGEERRAYRPPRFSGTGFLVSNLGLVVSLAIAGLVWFVVTRIGTFESTEMDVPGLLAVVVAILGVVASGALASYASRRFLVGELAVASLLVALLAYELMVLGLVDVPALQRFDIPGWLDWSVYAGSLYFGLSLFFVIGSALGFMVAGDDGPDFSTQFERLVARRHLRLRFSHYALLALIATLVPVIVYGLLIWPIRATWRLMRGQPVPKPLPPTVFMALLTVVGVMFGVMSLTVVLAVMGGFERDLKEKILGTNAHGVVHRYVGEFTEWRDVERKVKAVPGVRGVTPFILSEVMITTEASVTGAVLKGIDIETVGEVTDLEKNVEAGRIQDLVFTDRIPKSPPLPPDDWGMDPDAPPPPPPEPDDEVLPGIVVGREMARSLRVWIGDRVTVMNPLGELGPQGPIPRSRTYRVAAIFYSGMYEYDAKFAYIQLAEAQRFFRMGEGISGLELRFGNVDEARPMMRRILGVLEGFPYRTKDWGEMNKNLFSALRLERIVMFILLSFQVLIACICVIATLVMLVVEKRKEVATLKAMGAREGSIMKLFVLEGLIIGAIGTVYGIVGGLLFCQVAEGVQLDPEVYYITHLPVVIEPFAVATVAVVAMLLVFIATIYPARRGGSIAPVEGFREE